MIEFLQICSNEETSTSNGWPEDDKQDIFNKNSEKTLRQRYDRCIVILLYLLFRKSKEIFFFKMCPL